MSDKLTIAVVGLGIGRNQAKTYAIHPDVGRLVAVDVIPERIREVGQIVQFAETYNDYKEMLKAEKPDAVSVCLPNHLHAPVTIDCLAAGAHVICEKPMAVTVKQAELMLDAANKAGRLLMIHFNQRFASELLYLKKTINDGALGDIYFAKTAWHRRNGIPSQGRMWFLNREQAGGGPLIDLGVHRMDIALHMMGYPEPVSVSGTTYNHLGKQVFGKDYEVEDLASGYVRFKNGATLIVEASWASHSEKQENFYTELFGTRGGAVQRNVDEKYDTELKIFTEQSGVRVEIIPKEAQKMHLNPADHFIDCVLGRSVCLAPGEDGLKAMRIIEGLYESALLGHEVAV